MMRDARSKYIAMFNKALRMRQTERQGVAGEVRLELNKEASQELYRLFVVDALEKKPDGTIGVVEFNSDLVFASYPELNIETPVAWNGLTFRCSAFAFPEEKLVVWGNRWIHDEAPPLGPQDGLTGIIHSVTQPERVGGLMEFAVDFGSAPFQAFEELLLCLAGRIQMVGSYFTEVNDRAHR
jgi:hypothetical protein